MNIFFTHTLYYTVFNKYLLFFFVFNVSKIYNFIIVLTSNYGVPGKGIHDEESDRKAAMSGRSPNSTSSTNGSPNAPQSTANSSNGGDWRLGVPPSKANVGDGARHRVR